MYHGGLCGSKHFQNKGIQVSLYLFLNTNQLDALNFIISLFQASTCFEPMCSSSGGQKLYYTVSGIITPIGGCPVHGTATYRCDDTRDCIIKFCPLDDEQMCSKHVEAWNKLIIKFSASSWLILTLIVLMWRIGWAHNNARKLRIGRWDDFVTVHSWYNYINNQLDATITVY